MRLALKVGYLVFRLENRGNGFIACFVHFLYSRDFYFTGARESPKVDLARVIFISRELVNLLSSI